MPDNYIPQFIMTGEITNLVIEIVKIAEAMKISENLYKNPKLRLDNRIKSYSFIFGNRAELINRETGKRYARWKVCIRIAFGYQKSSKCF